MPIDLTHLRTFVAVAHEGHLTHAAGRLHISQPAASAHVRSLERLLSVKLFNRTNRGLELTTAGLRLAQHAETVLGDVVALTSLARELRGSADGILHLGVNADPELSKLGRIASILRKRHPLLELNFQMRSSLATKQGVRAGELDAGFLLGSTHEVGLISLPVAQLRYRIAGPAKWADMIIGAGCNELSTLPWVTTAAGMSNSEMRNALFPDHEFDVNSAIEVNNDLLLRTLIADGVGIGLVREDHAARGEREGIYALSALGPAETSLNFLYPAPREKDPVIQAILGIVLELWPERPN